MINTTTWMDFKGITVSEWKANQKDHTLYDSIYITVLTKYRNREQSLEVGSGMDVGVAIKDNKRNSYGDGPVLYLDCIHTNTLPVRVCIVLQDVTTVGQQVKSIWFVCIFFFYNCTWTYNYLKLKSFIKKQHLLHMYLYLSKIFFRIFLLKNISCISNCLLLFHRKQVLVIREIEN